MTKPACFSATEPSRPHTLTVHLAHHDVNRPDVGDYVRYHRALAQQWERLEVHEGWCAVARAVGVVIAIRHDIPPKLALGRLHRRVVFTDRRPEAVDHEDEVSLHRLNAGHGGLFAR